MRLHPIDVRSPRNDRAIDLGSSIGYADRSTSKELPKSNETGEKKMSAGCKKTQDRRKWPGVIAIDVEVDVFRRKFMVGGIVSFFRFV